MNRKMDNVHPDYFSIDRFVHSIRCLNHSFLPGKSVRHSLAHSRVLRRYRCNCYRLACASLLSLCLAGCFHGISSSVPPWDTGQISMRGSSGGSELLQDSLLSVVSSEWRNDVGQRYSELKPPARKRSSIPQPSMVKGDLLRKLSEEKVRSSDGSRAVDDGCIMLDLDKTCLFGNDGNDLGIALQWMESPYEHVQTLYQHLVNPSLRPAFDAFRRQVKNAKVVIYTMRSSLLFYNSNFRGIQIPVQFAPEWHKDGQLYIPADIMSANEIMQRYCGPQLIQEEHDDMLHAMERLIAARDAVLKSLALPIGSITVVVTSSHKDVQRTATTLGVRPETTYLWDDNSKLLGCAGVVAVEPYAALDTERHAQLMRFLEATMPAQSLDADLLDFMSSAPPDETVLSRSADGSPVWQLPTRAAPPRPWPVPLLRAKEGLEAGSMSPVTPADWLDSDAGLARTDGRRLLSDRCLR